MRNVDGLVKTTTAALAAATLVAGCGVVRGIMNHGVSNPITPEQSKAQVIDAAKDIVSILDLPVESAVFWHSSCNDQGEAPFQGKMRIAHPLAASIAEADVERARMIQQLQTQGWATDSELKTHSTALTKNGVVAVFRGQNSAISTRGIDLYGECRDVTTTKETKGGTEDVDLSTS